VGREVTRDQAGGRGAEPLAQGGLGGGDGQGGVLRQPEVVVRTEGQAWISRDLDVGPREAGKLGTGTVPTESSQLGQLGL